MSIQPLKCLICEEPIPETTEEYPKWAEEHKKRCEPKDPEIKKLVDEAMNMDFDEPCTNCGYLSCGGIC